MKTLTSARPKLPIFWNWVSKNITDQQKCVGFQKSRKSAKSLHPTVHVREFYCISKSSIFHPNKIYFCPLNSSDTPKTRLGLRQKIIPKCYRQDLCATLRPQKSVWMGSFLLKHLFAVWEIWLRMSQTIARKVCQNMTGVLAWFFAYAITSRNWNDFKQRRDFPRLSIKQERNYNLEDDFRILKAVW